MVLSYLTMENTDFKMITNLTMAKDKVIEAFEIEGLRKTEE